MLMQITDSFFEQQLADWELARRNYLMLEAVQTKTLSVEGIETTVQFNPSRILSSAAKVDAASIRERRCFLCREQLPEEQKRVPFGTDYLILVNPFPIFQRHLTIPAVKHTDQLIAGRMADMLDLAEELPDFVIFYNGPRCGASAPDHMHFQAGNKGFLPLEKEWNTRYCEQSRIISNEIETTIYRLDKLPYAVLAIDSDNKKAIVTVFEKIYAQLPVEGDNPEPMLNLLCCFNSGRWTLWIFPRKLHRPWQYFAEGEENLLISPASVDLGGVFITPLEKDFSKITANDIADILRQISLDENEFEALCHKIQNNTLA